MNNNYEVDILVNDKPIRTYPHDNKLFIEARNGVEYSLRIKNNTWQRIMAVCSVDGLDILNGKKAIEDGPGYIINGQNSGKFDGFRISDEKVAKFVFDIKQNSYAQSKSDGSEKNVGVVGIRIFAEQIKPVQQYIVPEVHHHHHYDYNWYYNNPPYPMPLWWTYTCNGTSGLSGNVTSKGMSSGNLTYGCTINSAIGANATFLSSVGNNSQIHNNSLGSNDVKKQCSNSGEDNVLRGFDMGTKFGEAAESKVVEVTFDRGLLVFTSNIYYASRESLIQMGVPITNEKQVSFPEPFVGTKYATPPLNWKG